MLEEGKISGDEANELKRAVGAYSLSSQDEKFAEDNHITLTGILHIIYAAFNFLIITVMFLFMFFTAGGKVRASAYEAGLSAVAIFPLLLFLIITALPVLEIIGGIFLMKRRNWARFVIIALSILMLFSFPFGTALGIYSLWVLIFREDANKYIMEN